MACPLYWYTISQAELALAMPMMYRHLTVWAVLGRASTYEWEKLAVLKSFLVGIVVSTIGLPALAGRLTPAKIRDVSSPGAQQINVDGNRYIKSSSIVEYQYEKVKVTSPEKKGDTLVLDLDEKAVGFSIVLYTENINYGYVFSLVDPLKNELIALNPRGVSKNLLGRVEVSGRGQMLSPNAVLPEAYKAISITPVPNSDIIKVTPGRWTFTIGTEKNMSRQLNDIRVSVFVKKANKAISSKTIGLITIDTFSTPSSEVGSLEDIKRYLDLEESIYERIGIQLALRNHKFIDSKFDEACNNEELSCFKHYMELMTSKVQIERRPGVLNAFFLKRNNYSDKGIANYSGSVSSFFESSNDMFDGMFVFTEPLLMDWQRGALRVFLHELGHHLGLYHTSEDNILDTKDINHWINGNEKPKIDNIMAQNAGEGPFTKGQRYVLYRSVAVDLYDPE